MSLAISASVFNPSDAGMLNCKARSVEILSRASAAFASPAAENRRLQRLCLWILPHDEGHRALAVTPVLRESTDGLLAARLGGWKVRMTGFSYGTTVDALIYGLHELGEKSVEFVDRVWFAACQYGASNSRFKYFAGEQVHEPVLPEVPCWRGHGLHKREEA